MTPDEIRELDLEHQVPEERHSGKSALWAAAMLTAAVLGATGFTHSLVRNKIHTIGREQTAVEREMVQLQDQIRSLEMKIEEELARKNLTNRLIKNRTMLKAILPETLVRVQTSPEDS